MEYRRQERPTGIDTNPPQYTYVTLIETFQIRVYYIGDDNTLCGSSFDGEYWHYGPGDRGLGSDGFRVDVASNSKLAAVHWARDGPEKDSDIRIYYQKNNDVGSPIFEHKYVASKRLWEPGYTFGDPVAGTSIAAINVDNGCIKVYFQSCLDRAICESCIHQGAEPFSGEHIHVLHESYTGSANI